MRSRRSSSSFSPGSLRLMVLGGLLLGLAYTEISSGGAVPAQPERTWEQERSWTGGGAVDVIDGDTFRYGGETIRVADIDTPEVHGRCAYETRLAARATERMAALLGEGPFELEPADRDEDRYGRKLRVVTRGGQSLGEVLVAEGLARPWEGRRRSWCG